MRKHRLTFPMMFLVASGIFFSGILFFSKSANAFPIFGPPSAYINCKGMKAAAPFLGDSANTSLGFAGGTATNITWDGSKMVLNAGQTTGTFVSRVIDNSCIQMNPFSDFSWLTTIPYYKELPATSESSSHYSAKIANMMTSIIGIWHFNETSYNGTSNEVKDGSGNNRHGLLINSASETNTTGLFVRATNITSDGPAIRIPSANLPAATNTFTFSLWYKGTLPSDWAALVYFGNNQWACCTARSFAIRIDDGGKAYVQIDTSVEYNQSPVAGTTDLRNGAWHHIAATVNNGTVALYIDGVKTSNTYNVGTGLAGTWNVEFGSGVIGSLDEVAYWSRVLSDAEVIEVYRRGANRVKVQVRNCTSPTCADNPTWRGPDNTASTYFTELNNNSNQVTMLGTVQLFGPGMFWSNFPSISLTSRYFQYRMILETDNTTYRPDVIRIGPGL